MGTFHGNPVFLKELRSHLLSRRQSLPVRVATWTLAALMVLLLYYVSLRAVVRGQMAGRDLLQVVAYIQLTLLVFLCPSLTANAITQEREQQTWNALLLTRLRADEIVAGKLLARLVPAGLLIALFVPLALVGASSSGAPPRSFLLVHLLLIITGVFYGTIGLCCSWLFRRTSVATAAASGAVAFLVVGTFLVYELWTVGAGWERPEEFPLMWLNPYLAMAAALRDLSYSAGDLSPRPLIIHLVAGILGTAAMIGWMVTRLFRGAKELEQ